MDHAEVRELLELAAVEPGGLERLTAGDTPESSVVAGHVAGCPDCAEEVERIRRDASVLRSVVRSMPPPELRERTLAFVAAVGRDRSAGAASTGSTGPAAASPPILVPRRAGTAPSRTAAWVAAIAALLVLAVAGTALVVGSSRDATVGSQADQIAALSRVTAATVRIGGAADSRRVELAAGDSAARATVLFSPGSTELVIVAENLPAAPAGEEYGCWVEIGGARTRIGRMFFAGDVAFWVGPVAGLGSVGEGARFGVTLVPSGATTVDGEPVLEGTL